MPNTSFKLGVELSQVALVCGFLTKVTSTAISEPSQ